MKTLLKFLLFIMIAILGVPAFAAPENHEEFARQYMPESQAVFERFLKECAETQKLRESLAEDLRVMNREPYEDASFCAISEKNHVLVHQIGAWAQQLKDLFFKHKAGLISSEQLTIQDNELAQKTILWERDTLKNLLEMSVKAQIAEIPFVVKIPNTNYAVGKYEVTQKQYEFLMGENPSENKRGKYFPVENVTWQDAVEFCEKLTKRERNLGHISGNQEYRLPTSKEWLHVSGIKIDEDDYDRDTRFRHRGCYYPRSVFVGASAPDDKGICGLIGNVSEWTSSGSYILQDHLSFGAERDFGWIERHERQTMDPNDFWGKKRIIETTCKCLGFRVVLTNVSTGK